MSQKNSMATAAVILGILALLSSSVLVFALPLGALSMLCALLSRTERRMPMRSITGLMVSLFAILYGGYTTVQAFRYLQEDPQARAFYLEYLEELCDELGMSETYDELFGDSEHPDTLPDEPVSPSDPGRLPAPAPEPHDDLDSIYEDLFRYFSDEPQPTAPYEPFQGGEFV